MIRFTSDSIHIRFDSRMIRFTSDSIHIRFDSQSQEQANDDGTTNGRVRYIIHTRRRRARVRACVAAAVVWRGVEDGDDGGEAADVDDDGVGDGGGGGRL